MSIAQQQAEQLRRRAILSQLYFAAGYTLNVTTLRAELEQVHGQVVSADKVRADLVWLADVGMVKTGGQQAMLTERGVDVVCQRAAMPGEA